MEGEKQAKTLMKTVLSSKFFLSIAISFSFSSDISLSNPALHRFANTSNLPFTESVTAIFLFALFVFLRELDLGSDQTFVFDTHTSERSQLR